MKTGQTIHILPSVALSDMKLDELAGRDAKVVEISATQKGDVYGCWAELLGDPYNGEKEWYIPISSFVE